MSFTEAIAEVRRVAEIHAQKDQEPGKPSFADYLKAAEAINTQGRSLLGKLRSWVPVKPTEPAVVAPAPQTVEQASPLNKLRSPAPAGTETGETASEVVVEQLAAARQLKPVSWVEVQKDGQVKGEWAAFDVSSGLAGFEVTEAGPGGWKIRYQGEDKLVKKGSHLRLSKTDKEEALRRIQAGEDTKKVIGDYEGKYSQITDWEQTKKPLPAPVSEQAITTASASDSTSGHPILPQGVADELSRVGPGQPGDLIPLDRGESTVPAEARLAEGRSASEVPDLSTPEKIAAWFEDLRQTEGSVRAMRNRLKQVDSIPVSGDPAGKIRIHALAILSRVRSQYPKVFSDKGDNTGVLTIEDVLDPEQRLYRQLPGSATEFHGKAGAYADIEESLARAGDPKAQAEHLKELARDRMVKEDKEGDWSVINRKDLDNYYFETLNERLRELQAEPLTLEQLFPPSPVEAKTEPGLDSLSQPAAVRDARADEGNRIPQSPDLEEQELEKLRNIPLTEEAFQEAYENTKAITNEEDPTYERRMRRLAILGRKADSFIGDPNYRDPRIPLEFCNNPPEGFVGAIFKLREQTQIKVGEEMGMANIPRFDGMLDAYTAIETYGDYYSASEGTDRLATCVQDIIGWKRVDIDKYERKGNDYAVAFTKAGIGVFESYLNKLRPPAPAESGAEAGSVEIVPDLNTPEQIKAWLEGLRQTPVSIDALKSRLEQIARLTKTEGQNKTELWLRAYGVVFAIATQLTRDDFDRVNSINLYDELREGFPGSDDEFWGLQDAYFDIEYMVRQMRFHPTDVFDSEAWTRKKFAEGSFYYALYSPDKPSERVLGYLSAINRYREEIGEAPLTLEQLFPPSPALEAKPAGTAEMVKPIPAEKPGPAQVSEVESKTPD